MNEKNPPISGYTTQIVSSHRRFSDEFKLDAVRLIIDEQYTFKAAARTVGVSENSIRVWHKKFAPPLAPCGDDATVDQLREENKQLRKQLKRAEMEREILKKVASGKFGKGGCVMIS